MDRHHGAVLASCGIWTMDGMSVGPTSLASTGSRKTSPSMRMHRQMDSVPRISRNTMPQRAIVKATSTPCHSTRHIMVNNTEGEASCNLR